MYGFLNNYYFSWSRKSTGFFLMKKGESDFSQLYIARNKHPHPFPNDIVEKWHGWNISKEFFSISQLRFWHETINSNPTLQPIFLCACVHNFVSSVVYMCVLCFCYNNVIISTAYNLRTGFLVDFILNKNHAQVCKK